MRKSKNWYYCIYDNRHPNDIPNGLLALDNILIRSHGIQECFYGFMRKDGNERRFGIEGYVCFLEEKTSEQVERMLPRFETKRMNIQRFRSSVQEYLRRKSIFIKYGSDGTVDSPTTGISQEWYYRRLH